jgi:tricorn protease
VRPLRKRLPIRFALFSVLGLLACNENGGSSGGAADASATDAQVSPPSFTPSPGAARAGYYRYPAIHGDTIIFTSEGDLWEVGASGGAARRLTTGAGTELYAAISPDGGTVAFSASYDGPKDVYTMPIGGGVPKRRTWDGEGIGTDPSGGAEVAGYAQDGRLLVRTRRYSTLPDPKLVAIDAEGNRDVIPLSQASEGAFADDGKSLFFTRLPRQPSQTKRYQGGTAESLWKYEPGKEAVPLTADWAGTSHNPMFYNGRVYFLSDRDGVMNVVSMDRDGHDVRAETHHRGLDVQYASLSEGRIAYQLGADIWVLDVKSGKDAVVPITIVSDFDQMRDHLVKSPLDYVTGTHVSPDGSAAVFTARGEIFTLPRKEGRIVKVAGDAGVRYREARYMPDGKSIVALSTETGETEFWKYPANGAGKAEQWTHDAKVLRWDGVVSPSGHWLAHRNKDQELWLYDIMSAKDRRVAQSMNGDFWGFVWSPDSQWLAYNETANNGFDQLKVVNASTGETHALTSDHYNSHAAAWSSDGKWIYFLSDRALKTTVPSPWGTRQPDPSFDRSVKIYELALVRDLRSPFAHPDELHPEGEKENDKDKGKDKDKDKESKKGHDAKTPALISLDFEDLPSRLREVPVPARNYHALQATDKRLCWLDHDVELPPRNTLACIEIDSKWENPAELTKKGENPYVVMPDVKSFEISQDRKKIFVRKDDDFFIFDSDVTAKSIADSKVMGQAKIDLSPWSIFIDPRAEFRQLFLDAWRLERDYFYDRNMHGLDWAQIRDRYLPLLDRVSDRRELDDVIAQMVSELSALHIFVRVGDARRPSDRVPLGALGAVLRRDLKAGGFVVDHVYEHDPDLPDLAPPLARPDSRVKDGEVILSIDGAPLTDVTDERALLRGKAGQKVLLHVRAAHGGEERDVLVTPITASAEADVRYREWEYTRRAKVDSESKGRIGYVHLQAMGANDIEQWAREFYPVFDRQGLIVDVRHNRGGNIDSWLLSKLMRKAWFYWQPRIGTPTWNMQYAFRGHTVVLCDAATASDGEAFTEGFRRLGLGKAIGTRTWGGEIWLSADNELADKGIATAAETGVYGPEGAWLIEGHGVTPDIVKDNPPHATFTGEDAQLEEAMRSLEEEIQKDPRPVPKAPTYPNKAFRYSE